jgi:23S rRNA (uracil1939-C5)-methyltransferase
MMALELEITAVANGGDGIGRVEGQVCFVPFALPGDRVAIEIVRRTPKALWGRIVRILAPSPCRVEAACPAFGECGACLWGHFAYPAQGEWKLRIVRETLARIGGIACEPIWRENPEWRTGYRTRAEFHGDGRRLGFFAPGTHRVVDIAACASCHAHLNAALARLRTITFDGAISVTVNPEGDETLVWTRAKTPALGAIYPQAQSPRDREPRRAFLFDGVPVVNGGFSQASLLLNRLLVREVLRMAGDAETILDCYCGSGNFAIPLRARAQVTGMDHHRASIDAARATGAGVFLCGGEDAMCEKIAGQHWDLIVLDPPRTGARALVPALATARAGAIIYVSCDPATLARDLRALSEAGWHMEECVVLDLFPHTPHIETLCRMTR